MQPNPCQGYICDPNLGPLSFAHIHWGGHNVENHTFVQHSNVHMCLGALNMYACGSMYVNEYYRGVVNIQSVLLYQKEFRLVRTAALERRKPLFVSAAVLCEGGGGVICSARIARSCRCK